MDRASLNVLIRSATSTLAEIQDLRTHISRDVQTIADQAVTQALQAATIDDLRPYLPKGTRIGGLKNSRYRSAADICNASPHVLAQVPGIGPQSAHAIYAGAQAKAEHERSTVRLRLDPGKRTSHDNALIAKLVLLDSVDPLARKLTGLLERLHARVDPLEKTARRADSRFRWFFSSQRKRDAALTAVAELDKIGADPELAVLNDLIDQINHHMEGTDVDPWAVYGRNAAAIYALLSEFASDGGRADATRGFVGEPIIDAAEQIVLNQTQLKARLRGYQAFGAQYALSRRRVILGDEMGLGKTVQALAAAAHLAAAEGIRHFLVVCPTSVMVNWVNETVKHTFLEPFEIHGPQRDVQLRKWKSNGGVAVTTFGTLQRISLPTRPGLFIVDEAHYIKNPQAQRTRAVRDLLLPDDRVLFMSGTPMENRIEEFCNLVEYLEPQLVDQLESGDGYRGPLAFRKAVAPAYLRRNQEDVLDELPELIETEEWVRFNGGDTDAYCEAVASGNFMAIRQAGYLAKSAASSAKLQRLVEIVSEAQDNGVKVIVFSYFLRVLETIEKALPGKVFGPLNGAMSSTARQTLIDNFTDHPCSATLLSQIEAGGVGLNIQAASIVIIAEPQWKPSTEQQAIARAHRMGQLRTVQVHRILAKDSIDEAIRQLVRSKSELFDEYARESHAKNTHGAATNTSWEVGGPRPSRHELVRAEQERLGISTD